MSVQVRLLAIDASNGGAKIHWFTLDGTDAGTGYDFEWAEYGVCFNPDGSTTILDEDGCPVTEGDRQCIAVRNAIADLRS